MSKTDSFRIISVTGAHSSVGKTSLCALILKGLKNFGSIKYTKTPIYCTVTDDRSTIMEGDKDTAIMAKAGAERVVWVRSPRDELESALDIAMGKMDGLGGVVVEGNSPVDFLNPHLVIFIIGKEGEIKPSAAKVAERADIVIINAENKIDPSPFPSYLQQKDAKFFWIDLLHNRGEIDDFLAHLNSFIT